ncbi:MAG: DMT family transporter [Deltaproteobacteria bacterium]|jgi:drug/metabolite transporter (DMT)-like permease|nr:DMT family transporter [Deltaproteobacteria bacterium]
MRSWQANVLIIWGSVLFGLGFVLTRFGLEGAPPAKFVLLRFALAFVVAVAVFNRRLLGIPWATVRDGLLLGALLGLGTLLQAYAIRFTSISRAAFISILTVLFIPILGFAIFREKPGFFKVAGMVLAANGLYFLLDPNFMGMEAGDVFAFCSVPVFSLYFIMAHRFADRYQGPYPTSRLLALQFLGAMPVALVAALFLEWGILPPLDPALGMAIKPGLRPILGLVFCSVLVSLCLALILAACQRHTTGFAAALCFQVEPVVATLGAAIILGEPVGIKTCIGGFLIIAGLAGGELFQGEGEAFEAGAEKAARGSLITAGPMADPDGHGPVPGPKARPGGAHT